MNEALSEVLVGYKLYTEPNCPDPGFSPLNIELKDSHVHFQLDNLKPSVRKQSNGWKFMPSLLLHPFTKDRTMKDMLIVHNYTFRWLLKYLSFSHYRHKDSIPQIC